MKRKREGSVRASPALIKALNDLKEGSDPITNPDRSRQKTHNPEPVLKVGPDWTCICTNDWFTRELGILWQGPGLYIREDATVMVVAVGMAPEKAFAADLPPETRYSVAIYNCHIQEIAWVRCHIETITTAAAFGDGKWNGIPIRANYYKK